MHCSNRYENEPRKKKIQQKICIDSMKVRAARNSNQLYTVDLISYVSNKGWKSTVRNDSQYNSDMILYYHNIECEKILVWRKIHQNSKMHHTFCTTVCGLHFSWHFVCSSLFRIKNCSSRRKPNVHSVFDAQTNSAINVLFFRLFSFRFLPFHSSFRRIEIMWKRWKRKKPDDWENAHLPNLVCNVNCT